MSTYGHLKNVSYKTMFEIMIQKSFSLSKNKFNFTGISDRPTNIKSTVS
jgi:hypothetical protein